MDDARSLSPLDGRYRELAEPLRDYLSEWALIRNRIRVEVDWLIAIAHHPAISQLRPPSPDEERALRAIAEDFDGSAVERVHQHERTTNHDVKSVEYYLRSRIAGTALDRFSEFIHFCCTSEDINNLAYSLMLRDAMRGPWLRDAVALSDAVAEIALRERGRAMLARTHGQPASPTTFGKELAVFVHRWRRQLAVLSSVEYLGKFNGAVGAFNAHVVAYPDAPWERIARDFVTSLGLTYNPLTTQIESHDCMAEVFHCVVRFNSVTLDFCRDMWSYVSLGYLRQRVVPGEVGSSTMPHKVNPIDFENAEANLGLSTAILEHLATKLPVSRLQRDLSDSSAQRNIGVALGHSVVAMRNALRGVRRVDVDAAACERDLNDAWEVLGEAIQTVLRKHQRSGYERLKSLTRGAGIGEGALREFIRGLDLPEEERQRLLALTPARYVGLAPDLVRHIEPPPVP